MEPTHRGEVRAAGPGRVRRTEVESELLTNEHVDGIGFKPRQELSLEVDALKVHIDSAENIKTIRGHDLLGGRWPMGLLDWGAGRGMQGKALEAEPGQLGAWLQGQGLREQGDTERQWGSGRGAAGGPRVEEDKIGEEPSPLRCGPTLPSSRSVCFWQKTFLSSWKMQ